MSFGKPSPAGRFYAGRSDDSPVNHDLLWKAQVASEAQHLDKQATIKQRLADEAAERKEADRLAREQARRAASRRRRRAERRASDDTFGVDDGASGFDFDDASDFGDDGGDGDETTRSSLMMELKLKKRVDVETSRADKMQRVLHRARRERLRAAQRMATERNRTQALKDQLDQYTAVLSKYVAAKGILEGAGLAGGGDAGGPRERHDHRDERRHHGGSSRHRGHRHGHGSRRTHRSHRGRSHSRSGHGRNHSSGRSHGESRDLAASKSLPKDVFKALDSAIASQNLPRIASAVHQTPHPKARDALVMKRYALVSPIKARSPALARGAFGGGAGHGGYDVGADEALGGVGMPHDMGFASGGDEDSDVKYAEDLFEESSPTGARGLMVKPGVYVRRDVPKVPSVLQIGRGYAQKPRVRAHAAAAVHNLDSERAPVGMPDTGRDSDFPARQHMIGISALNNLA